MNTEDFFNGLCEDCLLVEDMELLKNIIDIKPIDFCNISNEQIERIWEFIGNRRLRDREFQNFFRILSSINCKISNKKVFI
jgi:hypothetical protein